MKQNYLFTAILAAGVLLSPAKVLSQLDIDAKTLELIQYHLKDRVQPELVEQENLNIQSLFAAPFDGCFFGSGDERNTYNPLGIDCEECKEQGGRPKVNGSYVWGLTSQNGKIFWGTGENIMCIMPYLVTGIQPGENGTLTDCWVCENGKGMNPELIDKNLGDWVRGRVYVYDPKEGSVIDISPDEAELDDFCSGFRSAGAHDGVVFMGGPDFVYGSTVYAFDAEDYSFLGASHLENLTGDPDFVVTNIRKWLVVDDVLYFGVKYQRKTQQGGALLRWTGDKEDPFKFDIVGYMDSEAAELEYHRGRIFVGGWPTLTSPAGIYRSPIMPEGGFTKEHAVEWEKVWNMANYEVDMVASLSCGIGGFKSYKDDLYFGILNVSWAVTDMANLYLPKNDEEYMHAVVGSVRSSAMFRGQGDFNSNDDVEMLFGEEQLPAYSYTAREWSIVDNASAYKAKWGRGGFGDMWNNYTWAMEVLNDKLYIGSMDWSFLLNELLGSEPVLSALLSLKPDRFGYDCIVVDDPAKAPVMMSKDGLGNGVAYGVRNFITVDDVLYLGTANPFSLHEQGGWEMYAISDSNISGTLPMPKEAAMLIVQENNQLRVSLFNGDPITRATLTDVNGRRVQQTSTAGREASLSTASLPTGVYVLSIYTNVGVETAKVRIR